MQDMREEGGGIVKNIGICNPHLFLKIYDIYSLIEQNRFEKNQKWVILSFVLIKVMDTATVYQATSSNSGEGVCFVGGLGCSNGDGARYRVGAWAMAIP